MSIGKQQGGHS